MREMNLQHWDAPVILYFGIEFHEILFSSEHLAAGNPNARLRNVPALDLFLPFGTITGDRGRVRRILRLASSRIHCIPADEVLSRGLLVEVLKRRNRNT